MDNNYFATRYITSNGQLKITGLLLPIEIILLVRLGCTPKHNWSVSKAKERYKTGYIGSMWFDFIPSETILTKIKSKTYLNILWRLE